MARLTWGTKEYEDGLDRAVLYISGTFGIPWDGLVAVRSSSEIMDKRRYVDGVKMDYTSRQGAVSGTLEAISCPGTLHKDVFSIHRSSYFGLSYRVETTHGFKIHILYNMTVSPTNKTSGVNSLSRYIWNFTTKPLEMPNAKRSAHLIIDTSVAYPWVIEALEDVLYGTDLLGARLPAPEEVFDIFEDNSILKVTDHGDGTFTVDGPDSAITMLDSTTFEITWPSAVYIDEETYTISSL